MARWGPLTGYRSHAIHGGRRRGVHDDPPLLALLTTGYNVPASSRLQSAAIEAAIAPSSLDDERRERLAVNLGR
jgi:hypothetical protein